jgi:hypothetical protein
MPDADDRLPEELVAGAVALIPVVGPVLAPLGKRAWESIRDEWAKNHSKALRAAERVSGMSREDLADRISENPRLIPLAVRVLYTAGMTGQDTILQALGTAFGDAVRDPEKIDYVELLLIGIADLREYHIVILRIMTEKQPHPSVPGEFIYWGSDPLAEKSGYSRDLVDICIAGLVRSGLIHQVGEVYGVAYEITDLGRTALEVVDEYHEQPREESARTGDAKSSQASPGSLT